MAMSYSSEDLERIYLQISPYGDEEPSSYEITWCVDRINDSDVEYLRMGKAIELIGKALGMTTVATRSWLGDNDD